MEQLPPGLLNRTLDTRRESVLTSTMREKTTQRSKFMRNSLRKDSSINPSACNGVDFWRTRASSYDDSSAVDEFD